MRIFEVVARHAGDVERVVAADGSAELVEQLRLAEGTETVAVGDHPAQAGDLVLVDLAADVLATDVLARAVDAVPQGGTLMILLRVPLADVPVGTLVDVVTRGGLQVVEATPVTHASVTAAVVARRPDGGTLPYVPYLSNGSSLNLVPLLPRLVNEYLVEGLVSRARDVDRDRLEEDLRSAQVELERARASHAEVTRELESARSRLRAIESSRSMTVVRALGEVRRSPVRGMATLPRALRGTAPQTRPSASESARSEAP